MFALRSAPNWWAAAALAAVGLITSAGSARADFIIDLTTAGSSGSSQGAYYYQADPKPTGTGVFQPFVRIQQTGTERGYNTDARPVEFNTKDQNQWTHSLALSSLTNVTMNGIDYYKFTLDINEQGNTTGSLLSMDDFRLYLGNSPSLSGWNDGFGANSVKVYDLDAGPHKDGTVNMNYKLNSGSGSGDLAVYVPVSKFAPYANSPYQYVYLYSSFGSPYSSDAGFEEWSAYTNSGSAPPPPPSNSVPAPAGLLLGLIGMGGCLLGRVRRKADVTAA